MAELWKPELEEREALIVLKGEEWLTVLSNDLPLDLPSRGWQRPSSRKQGAASTEQEGSSSSELLALLLNHSSWVISLLLNLYQLLK